MFAQVVVDTGATSSIDSLTYEIPDGLAEKVGIGSCVLVPLASRQAVGYIIGVDETSSIESTRPIISQVESPVKLTQEMLGLAKWMSDLYMCPLSRAVLALMPGMMQAKLRCKVISMQSGGSQPILTNLENGLYQKICANSGEIELEALYKGADRASVQRILRQLEAKNAIRRKWRIIPSTEKPRIMRGVKIAGQVDVEKAVLSLPKKQAEALRQVAELGRDVSLVELSQRFSISRACISALEAKGIFCKADIIFRRTPSFFKAPTKFVELTAEQQNVVDEIIAAVDAGRYQGNLLFGVTASGKTEVYLRCIEHALKAGKTSLVLLPEIALTTQVMNIFKTRFGDLVAVLHSNLSDGERFDEWARIQSGEAKVVLGARSAVFAPLNNIGLVFVDEEHEGSYKQDVPPRYNARDAAIQRAKMDNAVLVLGSATPSIESYYLAQSGYYKLLEMKHRVAGRHLPVVHLADMRKDYAAGKVSIFSSSLEAAIKDRLQRGRQVMLLQNRRAYSTFILCRDCGFVMKCPNCDVALKFHNAEKKMSCHHCDYECPAPSVCPKCKGSRIGRFGIGTERVEEETKNVFPEARVLRMDKDTTSRKGSHASILDIFRQGEADILVGTQMIAKGLDFPNVTLVGVISADTSLNLPDFRASERTYQLISQVAGRAGRGAEPGEVIVQTFDPDQFALQRAVDHDYLGFYEIELEHRRELSYPPFSSIVNILSRDENDHTAESRLQNFVKCVKSSPMCERIGMRVLGPSPAPLSKLRGEYRWNVVLKAQNRDSMLRVLSNIWKNNPDIRKKLSVDVDPISML